MGKPGEGVVSKAKGQRCREGESDFREADWAGTEKGPVASATWRPLVDIADVFQEVRLTVEADWSGLRREEKEDIEMMST